VVVEESAALVRVTLNLLLDFKKSFVWKQEMEWTSGERVELVSWGRVEWDRRGRQWNRWPE
jgi:hypothetical protein